MIAYSKAYKFWKNYSVRFALFSREETFNEENGDGAYRYV